MAELFTNTLDPAAHPFYAEIAHLRVSCHFFIRRDGSLLQFVPVHRRAWHAGKSYWRGITDVNSASIGIELVNPGHEFGYRPFPEAQMEALLPLLAGLVCRSLAIRPGAAIPDPVTLAVLAAQPVLDWVKVK